jgi:hypothetical protein
MDGHDFMISPGRAGFDRRCPFLPSLTNVWAKTGIAYAEFYRSGIFPFRY